MIGETGGRWNETGGRYRRGAAGTVL